MNNLICLPGFARFHTKGNFLVCIEKNVVPCIIIVYGCSISKYQYKCNSMKNTEDKGKYIISSLQSVKSAMFTVHTLNSSYSHKYIYVDKCRTYHVYRLYGHVAVRFEITLISDISCKFLFDTILTSLQF